MGNETNNLKLPFVLNSIGESKRQMPIYREYGFEAHQFIWVKKGTGVFKVEGEIFPLSEGEGMFMRSGVPHSYEGDNLWTSWCTFFTHDSLLNYTIGDKKYVLFKVPDFLEGETVELQNFAKGNSSNLALSAASYTFITELLGYIIKQEGDDLVKRVGDYLVNNFNKAISLDNVADFVGVDKYTLCRQYKKISGKTVMDELFDIRLKKAKRMLRYSVDTIDKIARNCGFESSSYFCKRFRERNGITPVDYRKRRY